ncbi:hypothetical protein ANN_18530, partial [Periplaneta americana]
AGFHFYILSIDVVLYCGSRCSLFSLFDSKNLKVRIDKTVILQVVLCGCETWTLALNEEQRLRVFENKVATRVPQSVKALACQSEVALGSEFDPHLGRLSGLVFSEVFPNRKLSNTFEPRVYSVVLSGFADVEPGCGDPAARCMGICGTISTYPNSAAGINGVGGVGFAGVRGDRRPEVVLRDDHTIWFIFSHQSHSLTISMKERDGEFENSDLLRQFYRDTNIEVIIVVSHFILLPLLWCPPC